MRVSTSATIAICLVLAPASAVSAQPEKRMTVAAKAIRPKLQIAAVGDSSGILTMPLRKGAPFRAVIVATGEDMSACGSLGCEIAFYGLTASGKRQDISQDDILKNGMPGTKAQVFGTPDVSGMPAIVLELGVINGGTSFSLFRYDSALKRYKHAGQVSGYAAGKTANAARPVAAVIYPVPQPRTLPPQIEYAGITGSERYPVYNNMKLTSTGGTLSGSGFARMGLLSGTSPLTGSYANGECTVNRRKEIYRGPCDETGFSGTIYDGKGKAGEQFAFRSATGLAQRSATGSAQTVATDPPAVGAGTSTVWALGRVRILTERGQRCGPDEALGKAFCFGEAMTWLRRRPNRKEVDVIAIDTGYVPGSLVPYNSGRGWSVYRVARAGDGFTADTQRHFATRVQVPQGCMYRGVQQDAWYISVARGRKVAVEAKLYACASWNGPMIYAANADYSNTDLAGLDYTGMAPEYRSGQAGTPASGAGGSANNSFYNNPTLRGLRARTLDQASSAAAMDRASRESLGVANGSRPKCALNEAFAAMALVQTGRDLPVCKSVSHRPPAKRRR